MAYDAELVTSVASMAVRTARYTGSWTIEACVDFAWWSIEHGRTDPDDPDFGQFVREYDRLARSEGRELSA